MSLKDVYNTLVNMNICRACCHNCAVICYVRSVSLLVVCDFYMHLFHVNLHFLCS